MDQAGLHHVTAFAGSSTRNKGFYTGILGLSLVKATVNFDDPSTYHLYYGDECGRPGTLLTFFPIPGAGAGHPGVGEAVESALRVPAKSLSFWTDRLRRHDLRVEDQTEAFGEPMVRFSDHDGMRLALVGSDEEGGELWPAGDVEKEYAIRGLHGVTLLVTDPKQTGAVLSDVLGFRELAQEGDQIRYVSEASVGASVTLRRSEAAAHGRQGAGSVHHLAFRAVDDASQAAMARRLRSEFGLFPTEQRDRNYFRSIYFREPGGVLFEIATDGPGFAVDEAPDRLGTALKLPVFLEPMREHIVRTLPPLVENDG